MMTGMSSAQTASFVDLPRSLRLKRIVSDSPKPWLRQMKKLMMPMQRPTMQPGMIPAMNSLLTCRFVTLPSTIMHRLGGMMTPSVPAEACSGAVKFLG